MTADECHPEEGTERVPRLRNGEAKQMLQIIDGLKYNTESESVELIYTFETEIDQSSANWYTEKLYRTSKGRWFFAGRGGAETEYSSEREDGTKVAGEKILPISPEDLVEYLRDVGEDEIIEKHLPEFVEEA